jgi:hypothetical protein
MKDQTYQAFEELLLWLEVLGLQDGDHLVGD